MKIVKTFLREVLKMIPVLAVNKSEYLRFLKNNQLSSNKYIYVTSEQQLYGIERGSILLMFESFKAKDNYHVLTKLARQRELDCIRVL